MDGSDGEWKSDSSLTVDSVTVDEDEAAVEEVVVVMSNTDVGEVVEGSNCGRIGNG